LREYTKSYIWLVLIIAVGALILSLAVAGMI
jgi:hypothetical protein